MKKSEVVDLRALMLEQIQDSGVSLGELRDTSGDYLRKFDDLQILSLLSVSGPICKETRLDGTNKSGALNMLVHIAIQVLYKELQRRQDADAEKAKGDDASEG